MDFNLRLPDSEENLDGIDFYNKYFPPKTAGNKPSYNTNTYNLNLFGDQLDQDQNQKSN